MAHPLRRARQSMQTLKELILFSLESTRQSVLQLLDESLGLAGRTASFTDATPLLGALPELDSMAVVGVIAAMEERFDFYVGDDDIDGSTFETVGTLTHFVAEKLRSVAA